MIRFVSEKRSDICYFFQGLLFTQIFVFMKIVFFLKVNSQRITITHNDRRENKLRAHENRYKLIITPLF
jgi:hypothetical protein